MYNVTVKPGQNVIINFGELKLMYNMTVKPQQEVVFICHVTNPDVQHNYQAFNFNVPTTVR